MMFKAICYRFHNPRYAFQPYSGVGASLHGGRFNRPGTEALYLALNAQGAFAEVRQNRSRFEPSLIICYDIDINNVVDLRTVSAQTSAGVKTSDLNCDWKGIFSRGDVPPSWLMAERMYSNGYTGILVPSFANGADPVADANMVLFDWKELVDISCFDPRGDIPKNNLSWN